MPKTTPLNAIHRAAGARMVDFGGWDMPLQYGSQIAEHHAVRRAAGVFDASHMGVVDLEGGGSRALLERILANDVGKLRSPGEALYACMLNEAGGIIDDLIAYRVADGSYRLVVNAGTRAKDLAWIHSQAAQFGVAVTERVDLGILAVQGLKSPAAVSALLPTDAAAAVLALRPFRARAVGDWFVSRTGYTGEDGFELILPVRDTEAAWHALVSAGVTPCGLGARDTLRLEAGLNLYGNDMDETTHPFESALGWTVALRPRERAFVGRDALERILEGGSARALVGVLLEDRGVLRSRQRVVADRGGGEITSGGFSPTLERSIGFARVPSAAGGALQVEVRGKLLRARIVKPPFVRLGKPLIA